MTERKRLCCTRRGVVPALLSAAAALMLFRRRASSFGPGVRGSDGSPAADLALAERYERYAG